MSVTGGLGKTLLTYTAIQGQKSSFVFDSQVTITVEATDSGVLSCYKYAYRSMRTAAGAVKANCIMDETWRSALRTHLCRECASITLHSAYSDVQIYSYIDG